MRRGDSHRSGFALLCVLWALAILTVLTIGFGRRALLDRRAAAIGVDHAQARFLARGTVERGISYIENYAVVKAMSEQAGLTEPPAFNWRDTPDLYEDGEVFASSAGEGFENDSCTFTIDDAGSRVSVNAAREELLEEIPALGFRSVSEITRRRGGDDGDPAHPFVAIEEVRYLDGIDDDAWFGYGDDTGLCDLLTIWGDGLINLNTASREVLECIPDLDDSVIDAILLYRSGADGELLTADDLAINDMTRIPELTGLSPEDLAPLTDYCKVESQFFTIRGLATRRQGAVRAECTAVVYMGEGNVSILDWREGVSGL